MPIKKEHRTLTDHAAKIGEPVPRGKVDTSTAEVGVPIEPGFDAKDEIGQLRRQVEALHEQVFNLAGTMKSGARHVARRTEATVKLHPLSTLIAIAAIVGTVAFTVAGAKSLPKRSRYDKTLDELRDAYGRMRERF